MARATATALKFILNIIQTESSASHKHTPNSVSANQLRAWLGRPEHSISIKNEKKNNPTYRAESAQEFARNENKHRRECEEPTPLSEQTGDEQTKPSNRVLLFSIRFEWQNGITCTVVVTC